MLHLFHQTLEDVKKRIEQNDWAGAEDIINKHAIGERYAEQELIELKKELNQFQRDIGGVHSLLKQLVDRTSENTDTQERWDNTNHMLTRDIFGLQQTAEHVKKVILTLVKVEKGEE